MESTSLDASPLVGEYETILAEVTDSRDGSVDYRRLHYELVYTAEWTDVAADHLIQLARDYGAFALRNALALAVALQIEDGALGL